MSVWLESGTALFDSLTIKKLLHSSDRWQIYATNESMNVLVVENDQAKLWCTEGLVAWDLFKTVNIDASEYSILPSPKKYALQPIISLPSPETKGDALTLAYAFKATREKYPKGSLQDGIFLEQYSIILPRLSHGGQSDDYVIGSWLTGGVNIPATAFRRLIKLNGWLSASELIEVIDVAGLPVTADASIIAKTKRRDKCSSVEKEQEPRHKKIREEGVHKEQQSGTDKFELPGRPYLEEFFNEHIIDIILNSEKYQKLGIEFPSAVILHGPPGCGKTFAVDKLVEHIAWPSFHIDSNSIGSPYIHETGKKISELFDRAIDNAPSIVVIDEMESFLSERNPAGGGQHHIEEVAEFLRRIPEAINNKVLVIAMTNMIDAIDPAIRRRGRFDHIVEVGMPSSEEVSSLLEALLKDLPTSSNIDKDYLVKFLSGRALSDCSFVVREASRLAAKNDKEKVDQSCVVSALQLLPKVEEGDKRSIGFIN